MKKNHTTGLYNLSFVLNDQKILFLERNKEPNKAKLNGLGGKLENQESASQSMLRELKEEAGITALNYRLAALLRCSSNIPFADYMIFCFLVTDFEGKICPQTAEGRLSWINKSEITTKNHAIVDNIAYFLPKILENSELLEMSFHYDYDNGVCDFHGIQSIHTWNGQFKLWSTKGN